MLGRGEEEAIQSHARAEERIPVYKDTAVQSDAGEGEMGGREQDYAVPGGREGLC